MQRTEKQQMVEALRAMMATAAIAVALEYKNIDAAATVALRKKFRVDCSLFCRGRMESSLSHSGLQLVERADCSQRAAVY